MSNYPDNCNGIGDDLPWNQDPTWICEECDKSISEDEFDICEECYEAAAKADARTDEDVE